MPCNAWSYLLAAAVLAGCSSASSPVPRGPQRSPAPTPSGTATSVPVEPGSTAPFSPTPDPELAVLVQANNDFATDLYGKLATGQDNLVASPMSVALALAMASAGARGTTATQIHQALCRSGEAAACHRAFGTLLRQWQESKGYTLDVANRLFASNELEVSDRFESLATDYYAAPIETLDFAAAAEPSRRHINDWVAQQTHDKIQNLIPEGTIESDTQLVLANGIYFKGHWAEPFAENETRPGTFHAPDGDLQVPMMHRTSRLAYHEADGIKLLQLYYRGGSMAMAFLLPAKQDGLNELEARLDAASLRRWTEGTSTFMVTVALPKFKIQPAESTSLEGPLSALGMANAFDATKADFTGIAEPAGPNLFIDQIFHQAMVDVNELGTEAAAATGAAMRPTSLPPPVEPRDFIADHPFVFVIYDTSSGAVLFIGRVVKPSS